MGRSALPCSAPRWTWDGACGTRIRTSINYRSGWAPTRSDQDLSPPRRFEVLNFAVAAYSPMQRLETLKRKVLAFHPDLVIYSATTLDVRLMEIHLCDMLRKERRFEV